MRADNLIIVAMGLAALAFAVTAIVRWGALPVHANRTASSEPPPVRTAFASAFWSLTSLLAAAVVSGLLVGGILARLVMRVAGGVSPRASQGRLTDAEETVGEVTLSGTLGVLVFVGLAGGFVAMALYFVARPWLPDSARLAGAMVGVVVMGLLGPGDPLDPDNIDFRLLSYDTLTVLLIVGGSVLFGMAFASLAVKFERAANGTSRWRWLQLSALLFLTFLPVTIVALVYVLGRTFAPGRLRPVLERRVTQVVGRVVVMAAVIASIVRLALVSIDIISGA